MKNATKNAAKAAAALALAGGMAALALAGGCGNMYPADSFDKALVKLGGEWKEMPVKKAYHDSCDMVAVETDDQVLVTHSCNVVLIKNKK